MNSRTTFLTLTLGSLVLAGCETVETRPISGTQVATDANGKQEVVTYVSAEEYDRMTPQERERINARVGAEASMRLWGSSGADTKDVSTADLDKAQRAAGK